MTEETVSATTTISTSAETVFAVLADPSRHAAVDGSGRVRDSLDGQPRPRVRAATRHFVEAGLCVTGDRQAGVRRWIWRYDLTQLGPDKTKVTLSYDWSAVGPIPRQHIQFPPFPPDHLDNSLSHLAAIVAR
jgi:hypothetical protein